MTTVREHSTLSSLPLRLTNDVVCAFSSSAIVAPLICLIDKSIILSTHQAEPIRDIFLQSARSALRKPLTFLTSTPYLLIQALYFSTYAAANFTDTALSYNRNKPPSTVTPGLTKFAATSTTNIGICMYKDARFAKFFGAAGESASKTAKKVVPKSTLGLFALRDMMTIFTSFNIPPMLGPLIGSVPAAQFLAPAAIQFLSTPLHLLGLDLYNRPKGTDTPTMKERWTVVKRDWFGASVARMGRIIPAYGVGGVVNTSMRKRFMSQLDD